MVDNGFNVVISLFFVASNVTDNSSDIFSFYKTTVIVI